ncbi:MAG: response regulator [Treponema sp.]|nr:response regulator [Candidatus Treponema caballi]
MNKEKNRARVYSALEVANICGVVNQTAINWIRKGHLKAFKTPGGQYRVYSEDLLIFMRSRNMRIPLELEQGTHTLLIVDDDKGLNNVLAKYMGKNFEGFQIYQAYDGFEAGTLLAEKKPDLIFLDLNLPGIDGFSLCSKIKESDAFGKPLVFVMTSLSDEESEMRVRAMGIEEFFRKPLTLPDLADAMKKHLNL